MRKRVGEAALDRLMPSGGPGARVVVLCLTYKAPNRVVEYVQRHVDQGVRVELFVGDRQLWQALDGGPLLAIHALDDAEHRQLVLRLEHLVLFSIPGWVLRQASRLAAGTRLGRPLQSPVAAWARLHERIANAMHRRLFMPAYRLIRPQALARLLDKPLRQLDFSDVERIVAADVYSITLGARLARRYPAVVATTSLDP